jgi:hypothetical protein
MRKAAQSSGLSFIHNDAIVELSRHYSVIVKSNAVE